MGKDVILKFKGGSGGTYNYDALVNKPKINGVELAGELTGVALSLQNLLIAGENITIEDNGDGTATISSEGGGNAKALIATYNQTTAQEIMTYLETEGDFAPVLVKRGNDYYTAITVAKKDSESVYVKTFGSLQGKYYIFTYTVKEAVWATSTYGLAGETELDQLYQGLVEALDSKQDILTAGDNIVISPSNVISVTDVPTDQDLADALATKQDTLESGVNIKTINNISLLGSGNIDIQGGGTVDQTYDPTSTNAQSGTAVAEAVEGKADAASVYSKVEADSLLEDKADAADVYTKAEVDNLIPDVSGFATQTDLTSGLALKADKNDTYTKAETDALIPDVSDFVTDTEMQTALAAKADASSVYTKTEMDVELDAKQDELVSGTNIKSINNQSLLGSGNLDIHDAFIATYDQTLYADVVAAIDANKPIIVDFPNNHNLMCVTYSTYGAAGSDVLMYAVYNYSGNPALSVITVKSTDAWSITHTSLQELLVSGTNIKTVNGNSLLGSGDVTISGGDNVLIVDIATTPWYDIYEATTTNKTLVVSGLKTVLGLGKDEQLVPIVYRYAVTAARTEFVFISYDYGDFATVFPKFFIVYAEQNLQDLSGPAVWSVYKSVTLQKELVSGTNIKTINNQSLLGSGNLDIGGGTVDTAMSDTSENAVQNKVIKSYVDGATGDLSALATTANNNLVSAINEVNGNLGMNLEIGVEKWFGTYKEDGVTYQVYSKAIKIDALPAEAGVTRYDHGISGIRQILQVYGFCTNGFVMNAPRQTLADNIAIYQVSKTASNQTIGIEVGKDRSNVGAYVVLVYAKEN